MYLLCKESSIAAIYLSELRDISIQQDRMRFRRNLERFGHLFAYEISKKLEYTEVEISTPLGVAKGLHLIRQPVLATILRAGLPLHQGMLSFFDQADNAFIAAYRKHDKDGSFIIQTEYMTCPDLNGRDLIICDPMLATGQSLVKTIQHLLTQYEPKHIHIVSVIASPVGIQYVQQHLRNISLWIGAVDEELTAKAYIVPGLGDAGDLAFGEKSQD